jgi:hypothetical protein
LSDSWARGTIPIKSFNNQYRLIPVVNRASNFAEQIKDKPKKIKKSLDLPKKAEKPVVTFGKSKFLTAAPLESRVERKVDSCDLYKNSSAENQSIIRRAQKGDKEQTPDDRPPVPLIHTRGPKSLKVKVHLNGPEISKTETKASLKSKDPKRFNRKQIIVTVKSKIEEVVEDSTLQMTESVFLLNMD